MNRERLKRVLEEGGAWSSPRISETSRRPPERNTVPTDLELAIVYRRYWSMLETKPLEIFQAAHRDIVRLETEIPPDLAWRILRQAATDYHAQTGICPFCRTSGELHLPAEQISEELLLSDGG